MGVGAFANDVALQVSPSRIVYDSLFVTGFPYEEKQLDEFLAIYKHLIRNSRGVRRLGSAAIDLCYVAHGKFEAFYEIGLNAWDVAAGALIVTEAGGHVSTLSKGNNWLFGRSMCASNGHVHDELLTLINQELSN
jgi:myo-inositol-1(or 4)-monophosphatase